MVDTGGRYTAKTTGSKIDPKRVIFDHAVWVNYASTKTKVVFDSGDQVMNLTQIVA